MRYNSPVPHYLHRMLYLDPPEKGRKAWLCWAESTANPEGSNTCRDNTKDKTGSGHTLVLNL